MQQVLFAFLNLDYLLFGTTDCSLIKLLDTHSKTNAKGCYWQITEVTNIWTQTNGYQEINISYEYDYICTDPEPSLYDDPQNSGSGGGNPDPINCPSGKVLVDNQCVCPDGKVEDKSGNCVKKPCAENPILDIEIAPQKGPSGQKGALFGCTRYGSNDCVQPDGRNRHHDGIDLKNDYGAPIHAMYDGIIYSSRYDEEGAGYYTRIQSTVNGKTILHEYFHMQEYNRVEQNKPGQPLVKVKAGDIIGYQGDSGNLARALKREKVDSHVHIEIREHDGSRSWAYKNYIPIDPRDYLGTQLDNNGNLITRADCNN